jgi:hypothetical protein
LPVIGFSTIIIKPTLPGGNSGVQPAAAAIYIPFTSSYPFLC